MRALATPTTICANWRVAAERLSRLLREQVGAPRQLASGCGSALMILTCPACARRYRVADQEFEGSSGRTVRCANCGYLWHEPAPLRQPPEGLKPPVPSAGVAEAIANEPPTEAAPEPVPRLEIPPNPAPQQRRVRASGRRTPALAMLIMAAGIGWVFVRGHFETGRPPAAPPQAAADQPVSTARSPTGLIIRKVTPARTADGLVVDGEIANPGNAPRDVPRLHVTLQDSAEKEVQSETVDPPKARLAPGEVVHFQTPFAHPPDAATGVVVTFASS